jgi:hypothetical protein
MSTRSTIVRFFAPVAYSPKAFVTTVFLRIYQAVLIVASTNMLKFVTQYILDHNVAGVMWFVSNYSIAVICYFILLYLRQDDESHSYIDANHHIFRDNLAKVITMTNTYYEKMGTGQLIEQSR